MICEYCFKNKPDTTVRPDPFLQEIRDDDTEYAICDKCYRNSEMDL